MTTTNDRAGLVFTEPVTYINTECPEWCTDKLLHPCENDYGNGNHSRFHTGPQFGTFLRASGEEFTTEPGNVRIDVELYVDRPAGQALLDVEGLRQLASAALAAAEWMEAQR